MAYLKRKKWLDFLPALVPNAGDVASAAGLQENHPADAGAAAAAAHSVAVYVCVGFGRHGPMMMV